MYYQKLFPLALYKISGKSMLPTLKPTQKVLALNWFFTLKINDIVIAKINNREVVKRIVKIDQQKLWLEGDNPSESTDSKTYGWINKSAVCAKLLYTIKRESKSTYY